MHSSLSSLIKPEKHSHENDPGVLTHDWAQGELGWHSLISEEDMLIKSTYNHILWNTEFAIEHYSYWLTGTLNAILLQQEATSALTVVWTRSVDAFLGARVAIALILIYKERTQGIPNTLQRIVAFYVPNSLQCVHTQMLHSMILIPFCPTHAAYSSVWFIIKMPSSKSTMQLAVCSWSGSL